jgi:AAA domain
MSRRNRPVNLAAPYLRRVWLDKSQVTDARAYPFCLPLFRSEFALNFERSITIIVGENGTGKSTLLEGIAAMAGYDDAGGGKGYRPVDHSSALEATGGRSRWRSVRAGCRELPAAGFLRRKAFFPLRAILIEPRLKPVQPRRISFLIPTGRDFSAFSMSTATVRGSLSLMNRNRRCRRLGKSCSYDSYVALNGANIVRSSWPRIPRYSWLTRGRICSFFRNTV